MVAQAATVTMQDIAELARVRRSVVSMWRKRPVIRGAQIPFPAPVAVDAGVVRFDREAIVDYLIATGRGNNEEARDDAPAVSVPEGCSIEDVVVLLCLHALTGDELERRSRAELVAAAERVDGDDQVVLRELRAMRPSPELLRYVDDLVEASYGLPDALDRVLTGRLSRAAADRGLDDRAVDILRAVVDGARLSADTGSVALGPPAEPRLARRLAAGFGAIRVGDANRARRRYALLDGIDVVDTAPSTVHVVSMVGEPDAAALEAVDEFTVSLERLDVGVVVGSAAVLCDALKGTAARNRAQTLREGNLAMALRLPRGLWKGAYRQSLAVWVLRGTPGASSAWLADLDTESMALEDLTNDTVAALHGTERRAYRYLRRVELAAVLAGAAVVPRGARAAGMGVVEARTRLDRIYATTLTTREPITGFDVAVAAAPAQMVLRRRSLGELLTTKQIEVRRGSRIKAADADPNGTVAVLSADGSTDDLRLDPFDADRLYPRAVRTEPGDVIVIDKKPGPLARVDTRGGALVRSPSLIVRLLPSSRLGPHALAMIINEIAPSGSEWQTWNVPDLPPTESGLLDAVLAEAAAHKEVLRRHEQAVQDLVTNLIQGVAAGAVTLDPSVITMEEG